MNNYPKVTMIVDLQYGSTGKGLIAGFLAKNNKPDVVVNANMPNAGHTYIDDDGREWVHKVLPNGIVSPNLQYTLLGPGSVFSSDRLMEEIRGSIDLLAGTTIVIHQNAVMLKDGDKAAENKIETSIGSTAQGSAAAMVRKIARDTESRTIVRDTMPNSFTYGYQGKEVTIVVAPPAEYSRILYEAESILAEGAQGFSLGINEQFYPYCTSRDCTPTRFMADMAIPHKMLKTVVGTCRSYPIRVGGNSGGCYPDQIELEWADIGVKPELTTVTKRERRIFSFSGLQIQDAIAACQPDMVFYNFANYDSLESTERNVSIITDSLDHHSFESQLDMFSPNIYVGVGPRHGDVITYGQYISQNDRRSA